MSARSGKPRTDRWRKYLEKRASHTSTSRLRHLLKTETGDQILQEVYSAEIERRETSHDRTTDQQGENRE